MDVAGEVRVAPVQDDAAMEEFLRLPWQLYQDDPHWVPPVLSHQREFLDSQRGPFFEFGEAQYFLALRDGKPVGRISAHVNRLHDEHHGPETGFFGFFEAVPDQRVATVLLEAAAVWLREKGKTRLLGPLNFCIYDEMGLLVEGFDSMPAMFQTHNPPYYEGLLTAWGLTKTFDWHAYRIPNFNIDLAPLDQLLHDILHAQDKNVEFRNLQPGEMDRRAEEVFQLFNRLWEPNWGHVPLTRRQFQLLTKDVKPLLRPPLCHVVLDRDQLVGFGISFPDLNPLIQKLNGRLTLWDKLRLLYAAKYQPVKKLRAMVIAVDKAHQNKRLHLAIVLNTFLYLARHTPCQMADLSLVPENLRWVRVLRHLGAERYKVFRVFEREI